MTEVLAYTLSEQEEKTVLLIGASFSALVACGEQESFGVLVGDKDYTNCHFIEPLDHAVLIDNLFYMRCECLGKPLLQEAQGSSAADSLTN